MADLITIKKWDRTAVSGSGWVTFKDEDFGNPAIMKKIYGFTVTFKSSASAATLLTYAVDGKASTWITTNLANNGMAQSQTDWDVAYIYFTSGVAPSVQSIRVRLLVTSKLFRIKDFSIEYRPIHKEAT